MSAAVELHWTRTFPGPPERVWREVQEHLWREGAGMPPRPRMLQDGDEHGIGATRAIRILPGVELIERVTDGTWPSSFRYRVDNPGWTTFPVRWHRGEVAFGPDVEGTVELTWSVRFEPLPGARLPATWLTRGVIGRYLDALARRLAP